MPLTSRGSFLLVACVLAASAAPRVSGQETLAPDLITKIDAAVEDVLARTGAPSASMAVVRDAKLAYVRAYGTARLDPKTAATPEMRYGIGSISKQFTASAILLLAQEGRLSLDDRVSRWLPDLTRANDVTVRQLLSMTSGYQDYWPQDYVMPDMLHPVSAQAILDRWAQKPLDFEPGTKWQYSNTNYVIAGLIAEKASGQRLAELMAIRIFAALRMKSVMDVDQGHLRPGDASGYRRFALGPPREAPKEGTGWLYAMGGLAMTATDLARWDISLIEQSLLSAASYRQLTTETQLSSGVGARYGLGVDVALVNGRRVISHGGEISGFTAQNQVYPDDRAAIVVLTNLDATGASGQIAARVSSLLFGAADAEAPRALERARRIFEGLQRGEIERALFTANANAYFSEEALADFAASLGPLGAPQEFTQESQGLRGGMVSRSFRIRFSQKTLRLTTFTMPDGKLEQYQVAAVD